MAPWGEEANDGEEGEVTFEAWKLLVEGTELALARPDALGNHVGFRASGPRRLPGSPQEATKAPRHTSRTTSHKPTSLLAH